MFDATPYGKMITEAELRVADSERALQEIMADIMPLLKELTTAIKNKGVK